MVEHMALIPAIIATIGMWVVGDEPWEGDKEMLMLGSDIMDLQFEVASNLIEYVCEPSSQPRCL